MFWWRKAIKILADGGYKGEIASWKNLKMNIPLKVVKQPGITAMLSVLERGFKIFTIDFYLVGAVARDVWMIRINKIPLRRTKGYIDFAVLINDEGTYQALTEYLVNTEEFHPCKGNSFVLIWKAKVEVDLVPFRAIENEDGRVIGDGLRLTNISLHGFTEVYEEGLPELD